MMIYLLDGTTADLVGDPLPIGEIDGEETFSAQVRNGDGSTSYPYAAKREGEWHIKRRYFGRSRSSKPSTDR